MNRTTFRANFCFANSADVAQSTSAPNKTDVEVNATADITMGTDIILIRCYIVL